MYSEKMNVVFIMTDQQRVDSIGPRRHPCANYPNMEKLREESVNFENFYAAAIPCIPSRHAFLTGRNPWILGCHGNAKFSMGNDEITWMSILRNNGYRCVSVGKTHMIHSGSFHIQVPVGDTFGEQDGWDHFHPYATSEKDENYFDIYMTRRACDALSRLKECGPFALFIGFHAPHEPYVMPEKYLSFCNPDDVELPKARSEAEYESKSESYRKRVELFKRKFGDINDDMIRKGIAGHHCMLKMVDDCLGQIMNKLEELDLLENTIIVYTSDHGDLLGEHGIFNKAATFYEGEVHIPFMIRFPDGYKAGTNVKSFASSLDFVPTILDILNISYDASLPGYSLVPTIKNDQKVRDYVTSAVDGKMMIRTEEYKLWYDSIHQDGELYDLRNDPDELINLYNSKEHAELKSKMFELMLRARMVDDVRNNRPTKYELQLHDEIWASYEPEVVK